MSQTNRAAPLQSKPQSRNRSNSSFTKSGSDAPTNPSSTAAYSVDTLGTFHNYSVTNGSQYSVPIEIRKFSLNGNWFLYVGGEWMGAWYVSSYDGVLQANAERFRAGGEVAGNNSTVHTETDMGSGAWASNGWQKAGYVERIRYRSTGGALVDMPSGGLEVTDGTCYSGVGFNVSEAAFICSACGNGVCDEVENWCNCPADCSKPADAGVPESPKPSDAGVPDAGR